MTTVLIVVHIIIVAALIGVVLIQKSEGGALGIGGGAGGGFMTARGTANLLTRVTSILACLFFVSTIILALHFKGKHAGKSILTDDTPVAAAPANAAGDAANTNAAEKAPEQKPAVPVSK